MAMAVLAEYWGSLGYETTVLCPEFCGYNVVATAIWAQNGFVLDTMLWSWLCRYGTGVVWHGVVSMDT